MKKHAFVLSGLTGLLFSASLPAGFAQAQQAPAPAPPPAQAQPAPAPAPAAGQPDAQGNIVAPGAAPLAAMPPPPPVHACLQLYNGNMVFNFNVVINPNVTGFPITGGKITGTLCQASQWNVTGGHLGPNLAITATRAAGNSCATQLAVAGNFANPSSYTGTYGFPAPQGFQQHTLFLGYRAANAACP
jgi:hypothetical protein